MSQSANGGTNHRSGGFIGQGAFSHNVANRETFQGTPLLKAGVQLVMDQRTTMKEIETLVVGAIWSLIFTRGPHVTLSELRAHKK